MNSTSLPSRSTVRAAVTAGVAVAALAVAGCGSSGTSNTAGSKPSGSMSGMSGMASPSAGSSGSSGSMAGMAMITIKNYGYSGTGTVKAGATVMVKNDDNVAHTVTADKASAFSVTIKPGATATFKAPSKPGVYKYHCTYHAEMHGTLKVS